MSSRLNSSAASARLDGTRLASHCGMNWLDVRLDAAFWMPANGNLAMQN